MDECIPTTMPEPVIIDTVKTYEQLQAELIAAKKKSSERKKALRNANTLIQDLQLRLSNQKWKTMMWQGRADTKEAYADYLEQTLNNIMSPKWYQFWK